MTMRFAHRISGGALAVTLMAATVAHAETPRGASLDERVQRLEQLINSETLVEMLTRLDRLQQEVQSLRGQVELQANAIDELRQRQRDLYLDVDRRLSRVERTGGAPVAVEPEPATPAAAPTPVPPPSTVPAAPPTTPSQAVIDPALRAREQEAYQQAFDLLRELRYEQAIAAFRGFLQQYPGGRYAHIAQYWVGEANYTQQKFDEAIKDYQSLIDSYPQSPKVAEAMLKIGYSNSELGNREAARAILEQLMQRFPDTTEAGQAKALLQRLRGQG